LSIRARFGLTDTIFPGVKATIRLATGADNSPVSTTQILGNNFGKDNLWLDQAYITLNPTDWAEIDLGRQPNAFMHTPLLFDDNLNLDGALATVNYQIANKGLKLFATGGAFPVGYVSGAFPANGSTKTGDSTKWLFAGQVGVQFQPDPLGWSFKGALSFYDFSNVEGQLSTSCDIYLKVKQCSTDLSRPGSLQKGNTLFLIRNITPDPSNPTNYAQPQFAGLSYDYRELDLMGQFEFPMFNTIRGLVQADYVRNLAYDPARLLANLPGPAVSNFDDAGAYRSGPNAWLAQFTFGFPHPATRGDWNVTAGYRYIQPDAVIDAFNDHDFHQGGTNAKGYYILVNYFFANNAWLSGRWFSANEVYGPPLAIDVLQLELNTKF